MMISVIHPTRRGARALEVREYWIERAVNPGDVEWIFGVDEDDLVSRAALRGVRHTVSKPGGGCVRAINDAAATAAGEILMIAADDLSAPQDWDRMLAEDLDGHSVAVLGTHDGRRQDGLVTHPAITRGWYQRHGFFFPPAFKSVYADAWLTEAAWREGALVPARAGCVFEHRHPDFGDVPTDAVYAAGSSAERYEEGWKVLSELLPQRISLCMICGNEAALIVRCLQSAAGAFDELCLVRAIGDLEPDATVGLARDWCAANGKGFRFAEYANAACLAPPGNRRSPTADGKGRKPEYRLRHVDHFGEARNRSFALATGDWVLWLDCDDVLDEINCRRLREAALNRAFDALYCTYRVQEGGGELERERLIRRGAGVWAGAVHEVCLIEGKAAHCPQITVFHRPELVEAGAAADAARLQAHAGRNAAILERETADAPRHFFYLHADLKALGRAEAAIRAGQAALILLDAKQTEERYQVRLNLAELEPARRVEHLLAAVAIQPHRREALAQLAQTCLAAGDVSGAASYFRMMDALPTPVPLPWTHQGMWYPVQVSGLKSKVQSPNSGVQSPKSKVQGPTSDVQSQEFGWGRNLLRVRILRAAGSALAEEEHRRYLADPAYAAAAARET